MAATRRASSSITIPHAAIEDATLALQELPEKPRTEWPLRDAVERMRAPLLAAMAKGYTYDDLAQTLAQRGVSITAASLKYYMTRGRRVKGASPRSKSRSTPRDPKEEAIAWPENGAAVIASAIPEPVAVNGTASSHSRSINVSDNLAGAAVSPPASPRRPRNTTAKTAAKTPSSTTTQAKARGQTSKSSQTNSAAAARKGKKTEP